MRYAGTADKPYRRFAIDKAYSKLEDGHAEDGIQQHRQAGDHEKGAPIPELIAQLPQPDQADDRPAHARLLEAVTESRHYKRLAAKRASIGA